MSCNPFARAREALCVAAVDRKLALTHALESSAECGALDWDTAVHDSTPYEPGRPARPVLVEPRLLERRSTATRTGLAALIHAVAHIELNAVNLALDAIVRFRSLPPEYYRDWLHVAAEECTHFALLREHLRSLGHDYGDFSAHGGLWEMALKTAHDPLVRMAMVPRVLEARGLDASPAIMRRLQAAGDRRGAEIIAIILRDEVGHVAIGGRWFEFLCKQRGLDPESTFERMLEEFAAPRAVLPLNVEARRRARFSEREIAHIEAAARTRSVKLRH
jgi:uncharacterized ferritin-like protein (DUF455 family)